MCVLARRGSDKGAADDDDDVLSYGEGRQVKKSWRERKGASHGKRLPFPVAVV